MASTSLNDQLHWYKDAIIYELHIKAFRDKNRDGIGDFQGLLEKLDYLQELGITTVWLLPFYPSPLKDDGYDIADYYSINPNYGTLDEFKQLLEEAHKRNLKIVTELVINHTSDQHPWFQRARYAAKDSPERNFYVWSDDPQKFKDVRIIFQDFETSNWTWDPVAEQYYWHRFFHHQPDLNYDSPQVQEEILKIIDYWCEMGVDGFRLDAVPYLYEREGTNGENLPETHAFLKRLRKHIDENYPTTVFLAEANMWPEDSASYFGNGDECHMNYHFPLMPRMFMSVQQEDRYPITDIFDQTPAIPETCQWAIFLRNHDELTLEMVTDEERDFMYKVYAKDPKARINLGIRHRLAPLMDNDRNKIELMNSLLFSLPGTPVIYYGDEIGMGDNFYLGDRDGVRTPMQWSPDRNAGFSETNPQQLYLPVIIDPEYNYEAVNVEMQRRNTSSLFWFMKRMIHMRKNYKSFGRGDLKFLSVENPKIIAFTRSYEDETILIICNLSKYAQPAEIDLRAFKGTVPVEMFSKNPFPMIREDGLYFFTLGAHSFQWFVLEKAREKKNEISGLPSFEINEWNEILQGEARSMLENSVLPSYISKRNWFKGKKERSFELLIKNSVFLPFSHHDGFLFLLEITYESGLPETYQLAISFATGDAASQILLSHPEAAIAKLKMNRQEGILFDAFYGNEFHQFILQKIKDRQPLLIENDGNIEFKMKEEVREWLAHHPTPVSKMHTGDVNNTSINFDNHFFLKMYRKLDHATNPDVELSVYLSETAHFTHVPPFLGTIEWNIEKFPMVIGMMQVMIENHGDGNSYMTERLTNYVERIMARNFESFDATKKIGSLSEPVALDVLPTDLQVLLGNRAADQARLIGLRTAEMHLLLSAADVKDFLPEEYSLHYQRSLFSSMQSLVRETFQTLEKKFSSLPEALQAGAKTMSGRREAFLDALRKIYQKKLDIWKTRIHGTYSLKKLLMTGKDVVVQDFGGNPYRSYSERRLKRSPMRDLAEMIISFYYTAYEGFLNNVHIPAENVKSMLPFAALWAHYMSGFFLKAYYEKVDGSALIPKDAADRETVLQTFLLEKTLGHFKYELNNRPEQIIVPLHIIEAVAGRK